MGSVVSCSLVTSQLHSPEPQLRRTCSQAPFLSRGIDFPSCSWLCRSLARDVTDLAASLSGTYFTHEAKGADDAADADTAIINAEGGQNNSEEKKEYFI